MIVIQISDCHIARPQRVAYGGIDPEPLLARTVEAIRGLPAPPDVIIATGDLTDGGRRVEYEAFLDITRSLGAPVLPVAGNHDDRETLAAAFDLKSRFRLQPGFIQYAVDGFPLRILVVDTTSPRSGEPSLCAARLAWIEAELSKDERPVIIAMHHPPFPAGVAWMEPKVANWAQPLAEIVEARPRILRVICGHVHRPMTASWAGTVAMSAPSTAHQVFLDLSAVSLPRFSAEAPGFLIHRWAGSDFMTFGAATPGFLDLVDSSEAAPHP